MKFLHNELLNPNVDKELLCLRGGAKKESIALWSHGSEGGLT